MSLSAAGVLSYRSGCAWTDAPYGFCDESTTADYRDESTTAHDYRGCQQYTRGGHACQAWAAQYPHTHGYTAEVNPDSGLTSSYCRNPEPNGRYWGLTRGYPEWFGNPAAQSGYTAFGLWCFTTDPNTRWDYCDPRTSSSLYLEPRVSCTEVSPRRATLLPADGASWVHVGLIHEPTGRVTMYFDMQPVAVLFDVSQPQLASTAGAHREANTLASLLTQTPAQCPSAFCAPVGLLTPALAHSSYV